MNMPMCSRCKKNIAVVFITKIEGPDKTTQEGLCLKCARELGVKPLDNIMEQMGITEDDLEALSGEIGSLSDLNDLVPAGSDGTDDDAPHETDPVAAGTLPGQPAGGSQEETRTRSSRKEDKKRKYLNNYCENLTQKAAEGRIDHIVGRDRETDRVIQILNRRQKNNPCLIGEPGVGKTAIAKAIHSMSDRASGPFIEVNCAVLHENLMESELFGYEKDAQTGTSGRKIGKIELANHGTLFLDEIGNLSYALQAKLLVTLQSRKIVRVGSNKQIDTDIRLICATNRNIQEMVEKNHFREDLLYRINTIHIEIPPLRERQEDIIPLAEYFLKKYVSKYGKEMIRLQPATKDKLLEYKWPGNIRELQHAIEKAVIMCEGNTIKPSDFFFKTVTTTFIDRNETLEDMEKQMIKLALDRSNGNLSAVATQLGITRQTLYNKMKKYGL